MGARGIQRKVYKTNDTKLNYQSNQVTVFVSKLIWSHLWVSDNWIIKTEQWALELSINWLWHKKDRTGKGELDIHWGYWKVDVSLLLLLSLYNLSACVHQKVTRSITACAECHRNVQILQQRNMFHSSAWNSVASGKLGANDLLKQPNTSSEFCQHMVNLTMLVFCDQISCQYSSKVTSLGHRMECGIKRICDFKLY